MRDVVYDHAGGATIPWWAKKHTSPNRWFPPPLLEPDALPPMMVQAVDLAHRGLLTSDDLLDFMAVPPDTFPDPWAWADPTIRGSVAWVQHTMSEHGYQGADSPGLWHVYQLAVSSLAAWVLPVAEHVASVVALARAMGCTSVHEVGAGRGLAARSIALDGFPWLCSDVSPPGEASHVLRQNWTTALAESPPDALLVVLLPPRRGHDNAFEVLAHAAGRSVLVYTDDGHTSGAPETWYEGGRDLTTLGPMAEWTCAYVGCASTLEGWRDPPLWFGESGRSVLIASHDTIARAVTCYRPPNHMDLCRKALDAR